MILYILNFIGLFIAILVIRNGLKATEKKVRKKIVILGCTAVLVNVFALINYIFEII